MPLNSTSRCATPHGPRIRPRAGRCTAAVLFKAPHKLDYISWCRSRREDERRYPVFSARPQPHRRREGFKLTDPGTDLAGALDQANYCIWCHEQGKDSCSKGLKEKAPAVARCSFKKSPFGVTLARLPARRKDLRVPQGQDRRLRDRRARDHRRRQSDVRGDRPPHLQRLHEVVHLPEAGAGRHPAGGDAHAQGRARAAVGLRDLRPAHALESAQPARGRIRKPPTGQARAGRRASGPRDSRSRTT